MNVGAIHSFIEEIVRSELPDELPIFELAGKSIIEGATACDGTIAKEEISEFGFSPVEVAQYTVEVLGLIKGTIELAALVKARSKAADLPIESTWAKTLIDSGVEPAKAASIASKFAKKAREVFATQ